MPNPLLRFMLAVLWVLVVPKPSIPQILMFYISEQVRSRVGEPLSTQTRGAALVAVRSLILELHGWGLIEPRFKPLRALATPRSVRRGCCVNPRPIDDGHWLKLRTAVLSIGRDDLPRNPSGGGPHEYYPIEMVRAVAAALMFSGCRAGEITRFEVGCLRIERVSEHVDPRTGETVPAFEQVRLRVPVHKTGGKFTKPVETSLAEAFAAWECVRPAQRPVPDRLTGRMAHRLLCLRGRPIGSEFLKARLIPMLLRRAGLPREDALGPITSHRMRATLATRLYDEGTGLSQRQVMEWFAHATLEAGRHYIKVTPIRLMAAFHRGARLTQAVRTVAGLVDTQPSAGEPLVRYDLGHGWCTNDA